MWNSSEAQLKMTWKKEETDGVATKILMDAYRRPGHPALPATQVVKGLWQIHLLYLGLDTLFKIWWL